MHQTELCQLFLLEAPKPSRPLFTHSYYRNWKCSYANGSAGRCMTYLSKPNKYIFAHITRTTLWPDGIPLPSSVNIHMATVYLQKLILIPNLSEKFLHGCNFAVKKNTLDLKVQNWERNIIIPVSLSCFYGSTKLWLSAVLVE